MQDAAAAQAGIPQVPPREFDEARADPQAHRWSSSTRVKNWCPWSHIWSGTAKTGWGGPAPQVLGGRVRRQRARWRCCGRWRRGWQTWTGDPAGYRLWRRGARIAASVRGGNVLGVGARVGGARPWRGGPCGRWHWPHGGRCGATMLPRRGWARGEVPLWKHGRGVRAKARDRKKISRAPNASGALLACFFERYLTGTGPTSTCAGPEDRLSAAHEAWPRSRSEAARPSRRSATRRWSPGSDHPPPRRNRNRAPAQFPGQSPRERTVPLHEEKPGWSGRRRSLPTGDYQCRSSSPSSRTPFSLQQLRRLIGGLGKHGACRPSHKVPTAA